MKPLNVFGRVLSFNEKSPHYSSAAEDSSESSSTYSDGRLAPKELHARSPTPQHRVFLLLSAILASAVFPILLAVLHQFFSASASGSGLCSAAPFPPLVDLDTAFGVDIAFGSLAYSTARILDLAWGVVVGHGGQALIAWTSYRVHAAALTHALERGPVDLRLLGMVFASPGLGTAWAVARRVCTRRAHRARMLWLLASVSYGLAFPTLAQSMAGYTAVTQPLAVNPFDGTVTSTNGTLTRYPIEYDDDGHAVTFAMSSLLCGTTTETGRYSYGISSWMCFFVSIVHGLWVLGTYVFWMDVQQKSQLAAAGRRMGLWRAVMDAAEALRREVGTTACAYSEEELASRVDRGIEVRFGQREEAEAGCLHLGLCACEDKDRCCDPLDLRASEGQLWGAETEGSGRLRRRP